MRQRLILSPVLMEKPCHNTTHSLIHTVFLLFLRNSLYAQTILEKGARGQNLH